MQVTLKQGSETLRNIIHEGKTFIEAPTKGQFSVNLYNNTPFRQLAVLTVDGRNVIDGKGGSHDGRGWVLGAWGRIEVKGWKRGDDKAAAFEFCVDDKSYVAQVGDGTSNTGIIGVAIFQEKIQVVVEEPPVVHNHFHFDSSPVYRSHTFGPQASLGSPSFSTTASTASSAGETQTSGSFSLESASSTGARGIIRRRRRVTPKAKGIADVGTAYGKEIAFHTQTVEFERSTDLPSQVIELRYATRDRLKSWGVPVDHPAPTPSSPSAFPLSSSSVPAPSGWRG